MNFNSTENLESTSASARSCGQLASVSVWLACYWMDKTVMSEPDDIYEQLKSGAEKLSRGTVYNTLRQFCDAGLLSEVNGVGDTLIYDTNLRMNTIIF